MMGEVYLHWEKNKQEHINKRYTELQNTREGIFCFVFFVCVTKMPSLARSSVLVPFSVITASPVPSVRV